MNGETRRETTVRRACLTGDEAVSRDETPNSLQQLAYRRLSHCLKHRGVRHATSACHVRQPVRRA